MTRMERIMAARRNTTKTIDTKTVDTKAADIKTVDAETVETVDTKSEGAADTAQDSGKPAPATPEARKAPSTPVNPRTVRLVESSTRKAVKTETVDGPDEAQAKAREFAKSAKDGQFVTISQG